MLAHNPCGHLPKESSTFEGVTFSGSRSYRKTRPHIIWPAKDHYLVVFSRFIMVQCCTMHRLLARLFGLFVPVFATASALPTASAPPAAAPLTTALALAFALATFALSLATAVVAERETAKYQVAN